LSLAKDCYEKKLKLLTNSTIVDDAIRFVSAFIRTLTTKEVGMGIGLGLSIAYCIVVEMHKGDISFTSKPGDTHF
jgi:nitrogen-specific signal transduction histidine kinase